MKIFRLALISTLLLTEVSSSAPTRNADRHIRVRPDKPGRPKPILSNHPAAKKTIGQHRHRHKMSETGADPSHTSHIKKSKLSNGGDKKRKSTGSTLELVTLMFRHGDRAPEYQEMALLPKYEHMNETWQPVGIGQLTNNGKRRLYNLGKTVRARYNKFLGDAYAPNISMTLSTDVTRTKASALMFNAGLWPPTSDQQWGVEEEGLAALWQPVTYTTDVELNSSMNAYLRSHCYNVEYMKVLSLPKFQKVLAAHEKLLNYLSDNTGTKISMPIQVWLMVSLYKAQEAMGIEKPKWTESVWDEMEALINTTFEAMFYNDDLKRMAIGRVMKKIITDCQSKADGVIEPKERKLIVYSGHDTTVAPLFAALGGNDGYLDEDGNPIKSIVPSFGSAVILELHRLHDGDHAVKVLYNEGSPDGSFKPLQFVGYGEMCPLNKYIEMTKNVAVEEQGLETCRSQVNGISILDTVANTKKHTHKYAN